MGIQESGSWVAVRGTECYTAVAQWTRSRGFLQYRWKWPRDKFLQLLSNRRANRPAEYCESSVCTRSCGRLASGTRAPLQPKSSPAVSGRRVVLLHFARPFIPSTSSRRLAFFLEASNAPALSSEGSFARRRRFSPAKKILPAARDQRATGRNLYLGRVSCLGRLC